ncbi:hypothetical protein G7Y89_g11032 [Cudoniella acicularis]|uniref:Uncharacterized protein n=1 Tax=Cudoniella acicularis TaxID=354080 RepID=A0A8H4RBK8_9HELO|nr:hypothetical protein G7Y89_g11032 [Cudoniella acicularis]
MWASIWETCQDWQIWSGSFMHMTGAIGGYTFTLFLPIVLKDSLGFDQQLSFTLTTPPVLFAVLVGISVSWLADKTHPVTFLGCNKQADEGEIILEGSETFSTLPSEHGALNNWVASPPTPTALDQGACRNRVLVLKFGSYDTDTALRAAIFPFNHPASYSKFEASKYYMFKMRLTLPTITALVFLQSTTATTVKAPPHRLAVRDACNHDNCLRAVIASAFPTRDGFGDCSSYLLTTVTPATFTTTITVTATSLVAYKKRDDVLFPRQQTAIPTAIPAYASACSGSVRYSSACSCVSATASTAFAPTPTTTKTVFATVVQTAAPTLTVTQYLNEYNCAAQAEGDTPTVLNINQCVIVDASNSINFGTFIPGACSASQCTVQSFGDFYCANGITGTYPVGDTACLDADPIYALKLVCPSCPHT